MDDAAGFFLIVVAILAAVVAVGVAIWIAVATLLRLFAWLVFYWCAAWSLAAAAGLVCGFIVPIRVLTGHSTTPPTVATPDLVVRGEVIGHEPRRFAKYFGWDRAWPEYNPYQARRDAAAVAIEVRRWLEVTWSKTGRGGAATSAPASGPPVGTMKKVSSSALKSGPGLLWAIFVPIPFSGFAVGMWVSYALWIVLMFVIGGTVYLLQLLGTWAYLLFDRGLLSIRGAHVECPACYMASKRASYRCANPACGVVHRDISPGPLGVILRRCECGEQLPTTVRAASRKLIPLCPRCGHELPSGSGARRTLQIPVFGSVGAGKTRLLGAMLVAARAKATDEGGAVVALNGHAKAFLRASMQSLASGEGTGKTIPEMRPEGFPFVLTMDPKRSRRMNGDNASGGTPGGKRSRSHAGGGTPPGIGGGGRRIAELQLMDAAGEKFTSQQETEELTYVNFAEAMIYIIDPLALPTVRSEIAVRHRTVDAFVTTGNQELAYTSVVDRIRSEAVSTHRRHLAVVLTKMDALATLQCAQDLDAADSDQVREWIIEQRQDGLVRRIESDFGSVTYFACNSLRELPADDPTNPLRLLQWVLTKRKVPITVLSSPFPDPAAETAPTEPSIATMTS